MRTSDDSCNNIYDHSSANMPQESDVHIHLPRIPCILPHFVGSVVLKGEWCAMVPAYDGVNLLTELGLNNAYHA